MAKAPVISDRQQIRTVLAHYEKKQTLVSGFLNAVLAHVNESEALMTLAHSIKHRIKDPDHLADKIQRKITKAREEGKRYVITPNNLFDKIRDLAGIRILHLHTSQLPAIDRELQAIIREQKFKLVEGPFARTWDDEYREYYESIGVTPQKSPNMYTSIHYVIASGSETTVNCEIQVRTLMEEVWGEVDHQINYPKPHANLACREQILALARVTSSATRLVDSIFASVADYSKQNAKSRSRRIIKKSKKRA